MKVVMPASTGLQRGDDAAELQNGQRHSARPTWGSRSNGAIMKGLSLLLRYCGSPDFHR
jgi:hypothetical protein